MRGQMNRQKQEILRTVLSLALLAVGLLTDGWVELVVCIVAYAVAGCDVLLKAGRGIVKGRLLDENFLMSVASLGAFALGEYREAVAVMVFYRVGEIFQDYAVRSSRKAVQDLVDICPDHANVMRNGVLTEVDPAEVEIGEEITVKPGERIPLDGVITEGSTNLDTSSLTGESIPADVKEGDSVLSGCINCSHAVKIRVTKRFENSAASRILELVESASSSKAKTETFITRFARVYTPIVVGLAVLTAIIPSLFDGNWTEWISRALLFLVVSCPCALVISVPLTFFCGIGKASSSGILVKGSDYIETASRVTTVLSDKTGTLTQGTFRVTDIQPAAGVSKEDLLGFAAYAEGLSDHPIALSIRDAYGKPVQLSHIASSENTAGRGVITVVDGHTVLAGSAALLREHGVDAQKSDVAGTEVCVAMDGKWLGRIVISDAVRPEARSAVSSLRSAGVKNISMLSGDKKENARRVADELGLDGVYAELLPEDKVNRAKALSGGKEKTMYVGDGINDAPVLAVSDVGVAMGAIGSDAAVDAADVVITDDNLEKLAYFLRLSRKTMRVAWQNVIFSLTIKILIMILGFVGVAGMWAAVFADVGVTILAILNALRILATKKFGECK